MDIMKELENNDSVTLEQMFRYKLNEKEEELREAKKATKEYFMEVMDNTRINGKKMRPVKQS